MLSAASTRFHPAPPPPPRAQTKQEAPACRSAARPPPPRHAPRHPDTPCARSPPAAMSSANRAAARQQVLLGHLSGVSVRHAAAGAVVG